MLARQKFLVVAIGMGAYFVNQRWLAAQAEEKRAVFDLIEKITGDSFVYYCFSSKSKIITGKGICKSLSATTLPYFVR